MYEEQRQELVIRNTIVWSVLECSIPMQFPQFPLKLYVVKHQRHVTEVTYCTFVIFLALVVKWEDTPSATCSASYGSIF